MSLPNSGEILFIGSSMTRQSYDAVMLNEKIGKVHLLAYNGNQPCMIAEQFRYIKEKGATWKKYIIEFYPQTSQAQPSISDLRLFLDSDLHLKLKYLDVLKLERDLTFAEYYELFVTSNIELISTFMISRPLIDSLSYNGGYIGKVEPGSEGVRLENEAKLIAPTRGEMNSSQKQCWVDLLKLAKKENRFIEIWESPKYTSVETDSNYRQIRDQMIELAKTEDVKMVSLPFDKSDSSLFRDPIHLSTKGREIFTKKAIETFQ